MDRVQCWWLWRRAYMVSSSFKMRQTLAVLACCGLLAAMTALAAGKHRRPEPRSEAVVQHEAGNPVLPPQVSSGDILPALDLVQTLPSIVPQGMTPLYSATDWQAFQQQFGSQAVQARRENVSARAALASKMLAAGRQSSSAGLGRLLCLRAFALCYQSRGSSDVAQQALRQFMRLADGDKVLQVAAVWSLSHELAWLAATPLPVRMHMAVLAEKADVQLILMLLARGQLDAAHDMVHWLMIHETREVRANHVLLSQINAARILVVQNTQLADYLSQQYAKIHGGDEHAALAIYAYARFVRNDRALRRAMIAAFVHGEPASLDTMLATAKQSNHKAYRAGKYLQRLGYTFPPGILRHRTLHAAVKLYNICIADKGYSEENRVRRTLSRINIQEMRGDGARGNPNIAPLTPLLGAVAAQTAPSTRSAASARPSPTQGLPTVPSAHTPATGPAKKPGH
ncbi:MAG: hypothetical protein HKL96_01915 [Phycisphaerales bacterium]|nr:hypothetical protein [Phycisphaerales bacterium]